MYFFQLLASKNLTHGRISWLKTSSLTIEARFTQNVHAVLRYSRVQLLHCNEGLAYLLNEFFDARLQHCREAQKHQCRCQDKTSKMCLWVANKVLHSLYVFPRSFTASIKFSILHKCTILIFFCPFLLFFSSSAARWHDSIGSQLRLPLKKSFKRCPHFGSLY
jgi:hypothetical protein